MMTFTTKNYCFGVWVSQEVEDLLLQQLRAKHALMNDLRKVEQERRRRYRELVFSRSPEARKIGQKLDRLQVRIDAVYEEMKKLRSTRALADRKARRNAKNGGVALATVVDDSGEVEALESTIKELKSQRLQLWTDLKPLTKAVSEMLEKERDRVAKEIDDEVAAEIARRKRTGESISVKVIKAKGKPDRFIESLPPRVQSKFKQRRLQAISEAGIDDGELYAYNESKRLAAESETFTGTKTEALATVKIACQSIVGEVKTEAWENDDYITVQITDADNMSMLAIRGGKNDVLKIDISDEQLRELDESGRLRRQKAIVRVRMRLSDRPTTYIEFSSTMHRRIPDDAEIRFAHLHRRRVGTRLEYELRLAVKGAPVKPVKGKVDGRIVVVNAMREVDGQKYIQVCAWEPVDTQRRGDLVSLCVEGSLGMAELPEEGELLIPAEQFQILDDVDRVQKERMDAYNTIKSALDDFFDCTAKIPKWFSEACRHRSKWHNQKRLATVLSQWRTDRFRGDDKLFEMVEAWQKVDRRLYNIQENTRKKFLNWRMDLYRKLARKLADRFSGGRMSVIDWSSRLRNEKMSGRVDRERNREVEQLLHKQLARVAPATLQGYLKEAFGKTISESAVKCTSKCLKCGAKLIAKKQADEGDERPKGKLFCESCLESYDPVGLVLDQV